MPIVSLSDRDFACFVCSKGKAKDIAAVCPDCGKPIDVGPAMQGLEIGGYTLDRYISRGFYGATFEAVSRIGKPVALKIVPSLLYELQGKDFSEELKKYVALGSHPNIADIFDAGSGQITLFGSNIDVFYVVMEWIEGITLREFISTQGLDANVVYGAMLDMAAGVSRFEERNLWHNVSAQPG